MLVNRSHEAIWHPSQHFEGLYYHLQITHNRQGEIQKGRVVKAEQQRLGKVFAKSVELCYRVVLNEYGVQSNRLKERKLLPFYPNECSFTQR